jgi:hypothetical protein
VLGQPAVPATERPIRSIYANDVGVRVAVEGRVGPHETERMLKMAHESARLGFEDGGVDAAAVETEDAGELSCVWGLSGDYC